MTKVDKAAVFKQLTYKLEIIGSQRGDRLNGLLSGGDERYEEINMMMIGPRVTGWDRSSKAFLQM